MVCLLAAPWVQLSVTVSTGNGWPHNALWHHWLMPISCHFLDCTALLVTSLTHVSSAITSVQTFTSTLTIFRPTTLNHCLRLHATRSTSRDRNVSLRFTSCVFDRWWSFEFVDMQMARFNTYCVKFWNATKNIPFVDRQYLKLSWPRELGKQRYAILEIFS